MYYAHKAGRTVHNAMWMHFPQDGQTFLQDGQYMWSDTLLFTPVLTEGAVSVQGYFPSGHWFSMFTDECVVSVGEYVEFDTPLLATNAHARGGSVIPMQDFGMTTSEVSTTPFTLLVALSESKEAHGGLFIDDGIQLELEEVSEMTYVVTSNVEKSSHMLTSEIISHSVDSARGMLGSIEVVEVSDSLIIHCDGHIQHSESQIFADVSISNHANFFRAKFYFQGMPIVENYEFYWECH